VEVGRNIKIVVEEMSNIKYLLRRCKPPFFLAFYIITVSLQFCENYWLKSTTNVILYLQKKQINT